MIKKVNIYEAKTNLSRLVNLVIQGEEIIIARSGKPVARITPIHKKKSIRKAGLFKKQVKYDDDIDMPLPDTIIDDFYK